jgi:hypothetical protein
MNGSQSASVKASLAAALGDLAERLPRLRGIRVATHALGYSELPSDEGVDHVSTLDDWAGALERACFADHMLSARDLDALRLAKLLVQQRRGMIAWLAQEESK